MSQDNAVGRKGEEVQVLVVDMVGGIETDKTGKKAPAAEKPSSEGGNLSCGCRTIERAPGEMNRVVALNGV